MTAKATSGLVSFSLPEQGSVTYDSEYQTASSFKMSFVDNPQGTPTITIAPPSVVSTVTATLVSTESSNLQTQTGGSRKTAENNTTPTNLGSNINLLSVGLAGNDTSTVAVLGIPVSVSLPSNGVMVSVPDTPLSVGVGPLGSQSGGSYVGNYANGSVTNTYLSLSGSITDALLGAASAGRAPPLSLDFGAISYSVDDFFVSVEEKVLQTVSANATTQVTLYFSQPVNYAYSVFCPPHALCSGSNGSGNNTTVMTLPSHAQATVTWAGTPGALIGRSYSLASSVVSESTYLQDTFTFGLKDLAGSVNIDGISLLGKNYGLKAGFCLGCVTFTQQTATGKLSHGTFDPGFSSAAFGSTGVRPPPQTQAHASAVAGTPPAAPDTSNDPVYLSFDNTSLSRPAPDTVTYVDAPEPGSLGLLVAGMLGLAVIRRRPEA